MEQFDIVRTTPRGGDNYNYLLTLGNDAWLVDPLYPLGHLKKIQKLNLELRGVLITHTHWDHVDGIEQVQEEHDVPVYVHPEGVADLPNVRNIIAVDEGGRIPLTDDFELDVYHLPGHHPAHVMFHGLGVAILGDILFRAGCGSPLFGGNVEQIYESLARLPNLLSEEDLLLWGHNYDRTNLSFARHIWPSDSVIHEVWDENEERDEMQLPPIVSWQEERVMNPFLRTADPALAEALRIETPGLAGTPRDVFFELRARRNTWNGEP